MLVSLFWKMAVATATSRCNEPVATSSLQRGRNELVATSSLQRDATSSGIGTRVRGTWTVGLVRFGFIDILRESRALIRSPKCRRCNEGSQRTNQTVVWACRSNGDSFSLRRAPSQREATAVWACRSNGDSFSLRRAPSQREATAVARFVFFSYYDQTAVARLSDLY